jgi:hypothetical protein
VNNYKRGGGNMAGHFGDVTYNDTITSLIGTMKDVVKNSYYKYSDKPPTPVEYFHINKSASTLDDGSRLAFDNVGEDSPFRYNWIHDMMLYGIDTPVQLSLSNEDYGMETAAIEGDAIILPNTIEPYPDDQFIIKYIKEELVFKITHVEVDTLEDGSNIYKISYRSSTNEKKQLIEQVVEEYSFLITNVGTELNPILKSSVLDFLTELNNTIIALKQYYINIFYSRRVQTFIYKYCEKNFYDPYLIEFIRRNKVLEGAGEYVYVQHQTQLDPLFPNIYSKTFFNCLEKCDYSHVYGYTHRAVALLIESPFTIFYNRLENYWEVHYDLPMGTEVLKQIPCFMDEFIDHVSEGELLETTIKFYNPIIKYFHNADIDIRDLDDIETINYENNSILFYAIPCIIYCLEKYSLKLMSTNNTET